MRNDYETRAQKFIKKIFPVIEEIMFDPYCVEEAIEEFNEKYHRKVLMRYGEARIALITSDYVIKYDYDDECVEEIGGCENEIELYEQAVIDGFDYLFAKTTRYNYKSFSFYIMPRINHIGEYQNSYRHAEYFMTDSEKTWCANHNLTDLHCNNYGFRNGKVCIVDYAFIEQDYDFDEEEF